MDEVKITQRMDFHRVQALKSLAGYKFWMYGYHAGQWVELNKLVADPQPSPFTGVVKAARKTLLSPDAWAKDDDDLQEFCTAFRNAFISALGANEVYLASDAQIPRSQSRKALGSVAASVLYHAFMSEIARKEIGEVPHG